MKSVSRAALAMAVCFCGGAWAAAPFYSAESIVYAGNSASGPFAPNSILTIYGTDLSRSERVLTAADIAGGNLPTELNYTRVSVDGVAAPLLYVSEKQINFLVPLTHSTGPAVIWVAREGVSGPKVTVTIVDGAPALFLNNGYAIATHLDGSLVAPETPAHAGEVVVIYLTGLGKTIAATSNTDIAQAAVAIVNLSRLKVSLGDVAVDPSLILYAGLTPGSAGLYQINMVLPGGIAADPEIRVSIGEQASAAGAKLAVR